MRNVDGGQAASGQAAAAVQDASSWTSYYEDRQREGAGGVPVDSAGSAPQPVDVSGPAIVTGCESSADAFSAFMGGQS
jgi:hypothetical protein